MHISEVSFAEIDGISFQIPYPPAHHGRIMMLGEFPKLLPNEEYERYAKSAIPFLKANFEKCGTIDYPVNLKCVFYVNEQHKGSLSGYLQAVQDLLVEAGILADDNRNIVASVDGSAVLYDKENPRTEVTIMRKSNDNGQLVPKPAQTKGDVLL